MTTKEMRVLKAGACPSLSGKSKLKFEIGCDDAEQIHVRVTENNGGGFFSQEWVRWEAIDEAVQKVRSGKALTSNALRVLFRGKSVNTPAFLLAALKHEGLVRPLTRRTFQRQDPKDWRTGVAGLMRPAKTEPADPSSKSKKPNKKKPSPKKR
jgi:hypothetical protein